MNKKYRQFVAELKQSIIQSRYIAARLANKEQLILYLKTGKMLLEKINTEKWGTRVIEQIANDLQLQLPGLRGFSYRNLMKMKQLADEYSQFTILPLPTAELKEKTPIRQLPTAQLDSFWGITFTHHILLLNKCKTPEERIFYMVQAASQFWSVKILEHHIDADLYAHQGKLPNNFDKTLPELKPSALQVFRDEYLIDYIASDTSNVSSPSN